ncbi:hypothetical protein Tco_0644968 [Tanacetum coccineum]
MVAAGFVIGAALGARGLDFLVASSLVALAGLGAGESGSLPSSPARHPKDLPFGSLSAKFEVSKNILFIRQMKWRVWPRVEFMLAFVFVISNSVLKLLNIDRGNCRGCSESSEEVGVLQNIYSSLIDWIAL